MKIKALDAEEARVLDRHEAQALVEHQISGRRRLREHLRTGRVSEAAELRRLRRAIARSMMGEVSDST